MTMIKRPHNHSVFAVSCRFGRIEAGKPLLQFGRVFVGNNNRCSLLPIRSVDLNLQILLKDFKLTVLNDEYNWVVNRVPNGIKGEWPENSVEICNIG